MKHILLPFACLGVLGGCVAGYSDAVSLYYTPAVLSKGSQNIKVRVRFCQPSEIELADQELRSAGHSFLGKACYQRPFESINSAIIKKAKSVGAAHVIYCLKKGGTAQSHELVLAGATAPTLGISTTNIVGNITSSLGKTHFNANSLSTHLVPGQRVYANTERQYDLYDYDIRFFK